MLLITTYIKIFFKKKNRIFLCLGTVMTDDYLYFNEPFLFNCNALVIIGMKCITYISRYRYNNNIYEYTFVNYEQLLGLR